MDAVSAPCIVRELGRQPYEPVWRAMQRFTDARDAASSTPARRVMLPVCQCSSWRPVINTIG